MINLLGAIVWIASIAIGAAVAHDSWIAGLKQSG